MGNSHWHTDTFANADVAFLRFQQQFFVEFVKRAMAAEPPQCSTHSRPRAPRNGARLFGGPLGADQHALARGEPQAGAPVAARVVHDTPRRPAHAITAEVSDGTIGARLHAADLVQIGRASCR